MFRNPLLIGALTGLIVFLSAVILLEQRRDMNTSRRNMATFNRLEVTEKKFQQFFNSMYSHLANICRTVDNDGVVRDFEKKAKLLAANDASIHIISLLPGGVLKYTYPDRNKAALNRSLLNAENSEQRLGAILTMQSKKMKLVGPFKTFLGDSVIAVRLPLFVNNSFWGFASIVVKLDVILKACMPAADTAYNYAIARTSLSSRQEIFFHKNNQIKKNKLLQFLTLPDINWKIYAQPKDALSENLVPQFIISFILSLFIGIGAKKLAEHPKKLQQLVTENSNKLKDTKDMFSGLFHSAPLGLAILDYKNLHFIEVNDKFCEIANHTKQYLLSGVGMQNILAKDIYDDGYNELMQQARDKKPLEISRVYKHIQNDGKPICALVKVAAMPGRTVEELKFIVIVEDITAKVEADERMIESEKRFKSLFEECPVALWEEDFSQVVEHLKKLNLIGKPQSEVEQFLNTHPEIVYDHARMVKILALNEECVRLYKMNSKEEILEQFTKSITHEKNIDTIKLTLIAITQGKKKFVADSTIIDATGKLCNLIVSWHVIPGYEDNYKHVILSCTDVTNLKKSQFNLKQTTANMQSIIDNIDGIVWAVHPQTLQYTFVSEKAEQISSYSKEHWIGKSIFISNSMYAADLETYIQVVKESIQHGTPIEIQFRAYTKYGQLKWFRESIGYVRDAENKIINIIGITVDITDLRNSKQDLKKSLEILNEQNKRLTNFSYIVSHNLRSHTSNIQSLCDLILTSNEAREKNELIATLSDVALILNNTMEGLNEVVSISASHDIKIEPLNLKNEIDNTINILNSQIRQKKATIINNIDPDIILDYNKIYLESILLNLLSNALRYSSPHRQPVIVFNFFEDDTRKVMVIQDNGIGIDLNKNGHTIFGLFKTFSRNPDAKGVGLYITKNQVEAMGGNITVTSELDKGTSFKIIF